MIDHRLRRPSRTTSDGFTLIELLVVVVILGILSAVVVFAIRGAGDKGEQAAFDTDKRILRTALEAYCARYDKYPEDPDPPGPANGDAMDELVDKKFLSARSKLHSLKTGQGLSQGRCGTTGTATYDLTEIRNGNLPFLPTGCGTLGAWCVISPPLDGIANQESQLNVVRLTDGRVFTGLDVFDPKDGLLGTWSPAGQPVSTKGPRDIIAMVVIEGDQCGLNCGKVLTYFGGYNPTWQLYDPKVVENGKVGKWATVVGRPNIVRNFYASMGQLRDDPNVPGVECGLHCGKILIAGGTGISPQPLPFGATDTPPIGELYDPILDAFTLIGNYRMTKSEHHSLMQARLNDGRVLLVGGQAARVYDPIPGALGTFNDAAPPKLYHESTANEMVVLPDGRVLVSGRGNDNNAEVYDPGKDEWTIVSRCGTNTDCHLIGGVPGGRVLAYSSASSGRGLDTDGLTYLFNPTATGGVWTRTGDLNDKTDGLLPAGGVLMTGTSAECGTYCNKVLVTKTSDDPGAPSGPPVRAAEVYSPLP